MSGGEGVVPEDAARSLKTWINEWSPPSRQNGMVGVGVDKIIVYMHCRRRQWPLPALSIYQGWPVEWHWKVGRPVAASPTTVAEGAPAS